jgi:hypothetical protein
MDQTTEQRLTYKRRFTEFLDDDVRCAALRTHRAPRPPRRAAPRAPAACRLCAGAALGGP